MNIVYGNSTPSFYHDEMSGVTLCSMHWHTMYIGVFKDHLGYFNLVWYYDLYSCDSALTL